MTNRGFTLLEVLLATALLAVVLTALYGTFFLSHSAVKGVDESLIKLHEGRTAIDIMCRELEASLFSASLKNSAFKIQDRDIYGKHASRVSFTAFTPQRPGLSLISYGVEEKDGMLILIKELLPSYLPEEKPASAEIIEDIEAFSIEAKAGDAWVRTWDSKDIGRIPDELRVSITTKKFSLSQIVRPRIGHPI